MVSRDEFGAGNLFGENEEAQNTDLIRVAQAENQGTDNLDTNQEESDTGSQPSGSAAPTAVQIAIDALNVARLPVGTDISNPRVNGQNLEFVQPDGSIIVVVNGAVQSFSLFIGGLSIPAETVTALLEANGIQPAAGPTDGDNGPEGAHGNYNDTETQSGGVTGNGQSLSVGDGINYSSSPSTGGDANGGTGDDAGGGNSSSGQSNAAPSITSSAGGHVAESDLGTASASSVLTGTIGVSDVGPLTFSFDVPTGAFSSAGAPVIWVVNGGTLIGTANGIVVITATITTSGNYTITLTAPFDHPLVDVADEITLGLPVTVTDTGGLTTSTVLDIIVDDDVPTASVNMAVQLDDEALSGGNVGVANDSVDGAESDDIADTNLTGTLGLSFGADGGTVEWLSDVTATGGATDLSYEKVGDSLLIKQVQLGMDVTIAAVNLNVATGAYTVIQNAALVHASGDAENNQIFTLTYRATDSEGDTAEGTLEINIDDDTPVTVDDTATTDEDNSILIDVFANDDAGADGVDLRLITIATDVSHGTLVNEGDGTFTYKPDLNYDGADSFSYTIVDADGDTSTASVDITVNPISDAPTVTVTPTSGDEDNSIALSITPNLTDQDETIVGVTISNVVNGALSAGTNIGSGTWTLTPAQLSGLEFVPDANFDGAVDLSVTATSQDDGAKGATSATQTLTVTVNPISDAPTLTVQSASGDEDNSIALSITSKPTDLDETIVGVTISNVVNGALSSGTDIGGGTWTLTLAQLSGLEFVPDANFDGTVSLSVTATSQDDGAPVATSAAQILTVTVNPISDAPTLTVQAASGDEDNGIALSIAPSLSDQDETITAITVSNVVNGTLSAGSNVGSTWTLTSAQLVGLEFIPDENFDGTVTLSVTATSQDDGAPVATSAAQVLTVTVNPISDAPTLKVLAATGDEDNGVALSITPKLSDLDETITAITVSNVVNGTLSAGTNIGGGTWTLTLAQLAGLEFIPDANFDGTVSLSVTATSQDDGASVATSAAQILTVTVNPISDAPTLTVQAASGDEDNGIALSITPSLSDLDETITAITVSNVVNGTLSAGSNVGTTWTLTSAQLAGLEFIPDSNFDGTVALSVTATSQDDGAMVATSAAQTLTITVNPVSDVPTLAVEAAAGDEDTAIALTITPAITDADELISAITISGVPSGAVLSTGTNNNDGSWTLSSAQLVNLTIIPPTNFDGSFDLSVTATSTDDGATGATSGAQTITVTVAPVSDAPTLTIQAASGDEDSAIALSITPNLSDADETITAVTITGIPTGATLANTAGDTLTIASGSITLTQGQLAGLAITPPANSNANFDLTITATSKDDGADTATSAGQTLSVNVVAVSDAPEGTDNTLTIAEDAPYALQASDFGFSDPNDGPADTFAGVQITTLPTAGTLTLSGVAVNTGDVILIADINGGNLIFTPAADANGDGHAAFTFQVQDSGALGAGTAFIHHGELASGWEFGGSADPYVYPDGWGTGVQGPASVDNSSALGFLSQGRSIQTVAAEQALAIAEQGKSYILTFDDVPLVGFGAGVLTYEVFAGSVSLGSGNYYGKANQPFVQASETISLTTSVIAAPEEGAALRVVFVQGAAHGTGSFIDNVSLSVVGGDGSNLLTNGDFGPENYFTGQNTDQSPQTMTFDVTPVADAAEIAGADTGAVTEDGDVSSDLLSETGTLTISDVDGSVEESFAQVTNLTTLAGGSGALGSLSMTIAGVWTYAIDTTIAEVQSLGATGRFAETFTVTSVDGTTHDITVTVYGTNDAPVVTGDLAATVDEGGSYTLTTTDLNFADVDDSVSGVTFSVTDLTNGTVRVGGSAVTSFTGTQLAAGAVSFAHDDSQTTSASFNVSVEDGNEDGTSPTASAFNLTVNPINDAPTGIAFASPNGGGSDISFDENNEPGAVVAILSVTDVDANDSHTFTLVSGGSHNSAFSIVGNELRFNGVADAETQYNYAIRVQVQDAQGETYVVDKTVPIGNVNEVPTIDLDSTSTDDFAATFTEDGGAIAVVGDTVIKDVEYIAHSVGATNAMGATITLSGIQDGSAEALSLSGSLPSSISATVSANQIVLSGTASHADYQTAIELIRYNNTSQNPTEGDRTISITVNDGNLDSAPVTSTVSVVAVDDAAVIAPTDLILEGGFETPDQGASFSYLPTGDSAWTFEGRAGLSAGGYLPAPGVKDGDQVALLQYIKAGSSDIGGVTTYGGTISQPFDGKVGRYTLDFDIAQRSAGGISTSQVKIQASLGGLTQTLFTGTDGEYQHYSLTFDIPADGNLTLSFASANNSTLGSDVTAFIDNVVLTGPSNESVFEDGVGGSATASGTLVATDVDTAGDLWTAVANGTATYGTFVMSAAGEWVYTLNSALAAVQELNVGDTLPDSFSVTTKDGSSTPEADAAAVVGASLTAATVIVAVAGLASSLP